MKEPKTQYSDLLAKVQINIPYRYLKDRYLNIFLEHNANPEIGIDADTLDTTPLLDFRRITEILKKHNRKITLHGPFMDLVPGALDRMLLKATRERLERFFEIVPVFEPESVVCHTGYDRRHYRENWEEWLSRSIETWKPFVETAERLNFKLLLENVFEETPEVHRALFDAIKSDKFGFCLDVGHHNVFSRASLKTWLDALGDKICEVHLHDNDGKEDTHLAIGKGKVDFVGLFNYLKQESIKPTITLEPHQEETLWQSLASLHLLWPLDD
ncbi:MAG TPA: sugar phosphate isomerase/epimerase [Deltaproteobacteria bacterium]|nr:MAG: hypothetical protein DRG83_03665 [Deltaproteobacteria bacterium]RLB09806.1 MAG: hypothetical protein DRG59_01265 [Deltaproteobacteria bacterium]HDM78597.1 sugar phosphate isomerase/epimerase [Deltaproteobacteria bacterium]HEC31185.1 sugar phosphate isomerase/epimerase [Deltaproteobacteria bacterium]